MVLKSHRESAPGHASVPSTLCRFLIVPTLPLSAAFHESGRRPDPTSGRWREQGGGILHLPGECRTARLTRRAWRDNGVGDTEKPQSDIKRSWRRVREAAGLTDVCGHDLRHTIGGFSASSGMGLQITGAILGYKLIQATQQYAHLAKDPLRRAAERVGGGIAVHVGLVGKGAVSEGKNDSEEQAQRVSRTNARPAACIRSAFE
jgi:hypothetical protein